LILVYEEFDGEFVARYGQKVVGHDEELSDLMERIRENILGGKFSLTL